MASRSLNRVLLIGNLTRDPELRYTPQGNAVCTFGLATNRSWQPAEGGERREETEFHRIVSWNKLAELCSQLLAKGRKVFVEGRLQTRSWDSPDGQHRTSTEVVIDDMMILDSRRMGEVPEVEVAPATVPTVTPEPEIVVSGTVVPLATTDDSAKGAKKTKKTGVKGTEETLSSPAKPDSEGQAEETKAEVAEEEKDEINVDDIPF